MNAPREKLSFSSLRRLRELVKSLAVNIDEVHGEAAGRHLPARRLKAAIKAIDKAIADSTPTEVCPYCNGRGCKACRQTGWVPKIVFNAAPQELKR